MSARVLVVGAGPVGLMAALQLAQRGHQVEIIDAGQTFTPPEQSRALAIHGRTLDLLTRLDLETRFVAAGQEIRGAEFRSNGRTKAKLDFSDAGIERNFILSLPQGQTERLLAESLHKHGVEVEWNTKLASLTNPGQPAATLIGPDGERTVSPDFVVGADGARSQVRASLGLTFDGESPPEEFGLVDVVLDRPIDPTRVVADRVRGQLLAYIPINERLVRYISNRPDIGEMIPDQVGIQEIAWRSTFRNSYRHVTTLQRGRTFVIGDAAHIHSPAGGRGMNLGMEDAAWFAHLLDRGQLDQFTQDRLPHIKATLRFSHQSINQATLPGWLGNFLFSTVVPLALKSRAIRRKAARAVLFADQPRPDFS